MFRTSFISRVAPSLALLNKGHVASWFGNRGFGFIEDDADKKQHFVHFSALQTEAGGFRALTLGQEVEFEVTTQDGRTRAENVTAADGAKLPSGPRPPPDAGRGGRGGNYYGDGNRGGGGGGDYNRRPRRQGGNRGDNYNRGDNNNRGGGDFGDAFD